MAKRETMFAAIEKWKRSGMSKAAFARESGIAVQTFHNWYRLYQEQPGTNAVPAFIEVVTGDDAESRTRERGAGEPRMRVEYPDGVIISIY